MPVIWDISFVSGFDLEYIKYSLGKIWSVCIFYSQRCDHFIKCIFFGPQVGMLLKCLECSKKKNQK